MEIIFLVCKDIVIFLLDDSFMVVVMWIYFLEKNIFL